MNQPKSMYLLDLNFDNFFLDPSPGRIIGVSGLKGSGKSSIARAFLRFGDYAKYSFANPLKDSVNAAFGFPVNLLDHEKEKVDPYWGISPRDAWQYFGTEVFRDTIHPDFWIARAHLEILRDMHESLVEDAIAKFNVVFDDVRFANEIKYILQNSGRIIRVTRPDRISVDRHRSEPHEDSIYAEAKEKGRYHEIVNNGTFSDLMVKAVALRDHLSSLS